MSLLIEIFAAVFTLICVYLTAKRNIWSWPIGIIGIGLYASVFWDAKLYADFILQLFFLIQSFIGCIEWARNREDNKSFITKVEKLSNKQHVLWAIPVIFVYLIAAFVFSHYTNAALPYVDSMTATLSLFANYLLMKRKFENWYIWIFVDIVYVGMFTYKGLYTSAILYFILLIIACKGFYSWKKNIIK